jgi:hypothetical protein
MKTYNSFLEMATATGALNSVALDSLRVYNDDTVTPVTPGAGNSSLQQGLDEKSTRAQGQDAQKQQAEKAKPVGNTPAAEPNKFQQDLEDDLEKRNF